VKLSSHAPSDGVEVLDVGLESEHVRVERRGQVGFVVFDRPESLNALSNAMCRDLAVAWRALDGEPEVRVVVVTGTGRGFCVGLDLKEFTSDRAGHDDIAKRAQENRRQLTAMDLEVRKPVLCAVNGVCAGGGLHFVVDSDIVIAAESATFFDPHVSVGQVSVAEGIALRYRMPFGEVMRTLLAGSAQRLTAQRAYEIGLVTEVVPDDQLIPASLELATAIAALEPEVAAEAKRALWASVGHSLGAPDLAGRHG
jgi:enoyl-CoA hydratase